MTARAAPALYVVRPLRPKDQTFKATGNDCNFVLLATQIGVHDPKLRDAQECGSEAGMFASLQHRGLIRN